MLGHGEEGTGSASWVGSGGDEMQEQAGAEEHGAVRAREVIRGESAYSAWRSREEQLNCFCLVRHLFPLRHSSEWRRRYWSSTFQDSTS
jgi:hypothetical protein